MKASKPAHMIAETPLKRVSELTLLLINIQNDGNQAFAAKRCARCHLEIGDYIAVFHQYFIFLLLDQNVLGQFQSQT